MQQRGSNTTMESEEVDRSSTPPLSRGRHNSKLKVLVRSHAMREETSPPREPSPNLLHSPCIKLIPSPEVSPDSPHPVVVLSPSLNSPCKSPQCLSPTSTLVPSPNSRCSPSLSAPNDHPNRLQSDHQLDSPGSGFGSSSPKYLNKVNNSKNSDAASKQTSHNVKKKYMCDCQNQNCIKCIKTQERNINNNLTNVNNNVMGSPNTLTVSRASSRGKLRQQSSSQGSFESSSNSPCLSRDSSSEQYTDTTGIDLEQFIPETLNRNAKDRALMLRIEQELVNLAKDRCKSYFKFPPMSSYQRMLVHRCAAYFGMDHNIEPITGKSVVVNKTKNTRIPDVEFKEHIKEDIVFSEEPRRSILKRDSNSVEDYSFKSPDRSFSSENRRSKSIEEREEEYEKVRRRIFNRGMQGGSSEDFGWSEEPWSSTESDYSSRFRLQPPELHRRHFGKLIKVHSEDAAEALRPCVAKSYSFGGYGGISVLSRGDSVMSTHSAGPRLLTKQDSAASSVSWRLSPSSSGYKSQSQMSESVTPSPTSTPHPVSDSRQNSNGSSENQENRSDSSTNRIIWAVTDIHNVPKGSIIIDPKTWKPMINEDGSMYHYDPNNLPPGMAPVTAPAKPPPSPYKPPKEVMSASPKRNRAMSMKTSPTRKSNLTNSSTSPSLPFSPPLLATSMPHRTFSYVQAENVVSMPQQHFSGYTSTFAAPTAAADNGTMYQQPYIIYTAPYGVHVQQQYESRMEPPPPQMTDIANTYYIPEATGVTPTQSISYQHPQAGSYWNQPVAFYQNNPQANPPAQRFSTGPSQQGFVPTGYPTNYLPPATQPTHNPEMVYPNQPIQVMYQNQPTPSNQILYQNQPPPLIYSHNTMYPAPNYPPPQMTPQHMPQNVTPYPQSTPTPNSCTSSSSGPPFPIPGTGQESQNFVHLAQSMHQMSLGGMQGPPNYITNKGPPQFDFRQKGNGGLKGNKFAAQKNFIMGSSQSSTGTNSPAATVIAGYCPPQNVPGVYRTPPETPPTQQFSFPPNFNVPPVMFRQISNIPANTPGTSRSSRSPTPASDVTHFERQRMSLPPNLYQGMPCVVPTDPRLIPGRAQSAVYRSQNTQVNKSNFSQTSENRSHKGRKSKTNKQPGLPPSGK